MNQIIRQCVFVLPTLLVVFGSFDTALAQPPTAPPDMFINAEQTDQDFQINVTWKDFSDEDMYQLLGSISSTPGPIFEGSSGNIRLGSSWELIANLPANSTEFLHDTHFSWTYAICAYKEFEINCYCCTNHIAPKYPPSPASVDSMQVSQRTINSLRVQWTQSANTRYSRAEIRRAGGSNVVYSVENDPDQSVSFTGLDSNVLFELKVCVRNEEQTAADESCRTIQSSTLPQAPLSPTQVEVIQGDPNPRQRTVTFRFNNRQSNAVVGIKVNIIKDDQIVDSHTFYPQSFDERDYQHTFAGLEPFTGYEAWVVPYNQSGVGEAAGVGFTTPTEIILSIHPLSGDSAMLRLVRADVGEYTIEARSGFLPDPWLTISKIRQVRLGEPRMVITGISGPKQLRVKWKLAYLRAETTGTAAPLDVGAPELVSVHSSTVILPGDPPREGNRFTVRFRITVGGAGRYVLQRKYASGWATVKRSAFKRFADNEIVSLVHNTSQLLTEYRVCKAIKSIAVPRGLACSESSGWATEGIQRLGTELRFPRNLPAMRIERPQ